MPAKTYLFYHVVVTTKYRRPLLANHRALSFAVHAAYDRAAGRGGQVVAFNPGPDWSHVHILVILPPHQAIADYVRDFKSQSARQGNAALAATGRPFWARRYFAATVGAGSLDAARRYVEEQWNH